MIPVLLALAACTAEEEAATVPPALCDEVPERVTWDSFGRGFVTQNCQHCHGSLVVDLQRNGAPTDVFFDTEEDAWMWADRILERAASEAPTMPPQGGVDEEDRTLVQAWLSCGG